MNTKRAKKRHALMTPAQQAEHENKMVAEYNAAFPVGAVVWYWTSLVPGAAVKETRIQHPFFIVPGKTAAERIPATFVEGRRGYVSAFHITEPNEDQRPHLDLEVIHSGEGGRP